MVVDNIKNAGLYSGLGDRIKRALSYLQETDISKLEPGRYEIDGNNLYVLVQDYETKPMSEGKWEAHKKYIDVQYVVEGLEQMGYALTDNLKVTKEYDTEGDYLLFDGKGSMVLCPAGTFVIFFPDDSHMPCMAVDSPKPVKKAVAKVLI